MLLSPPPFQSQALAALKAEFPASFAVLISVAWALAQSVDKRWVEGLGFGVYTQGLHSPFWGSSLESYKVIPKRNYYGAFGKQNKPQHPPDTPKPKLKTLVTP